VLNSLKIKILLYQINQQQRNQVKRRIGEVRWTSNPAPKFDYAEKRLKWEQDVRNISESINILEGLDFLRLKFGNQK
jgi:hypothetical protein